MSNDRLDEILDNRYGTQITHANCGDECMEKQNYQELKADLLAWHREECERIIGEDETMVDKDNDPPYKGAYMIVRNSLRVEQRERLRASLEVEDE